MNNYEIFSLFYIPYSLIMWSIDYLSDKDITHKEMKIGIFQYLHHLIITIINLSFMLILFYKGITITGLTVIVMIIAQIGFLINKDKCWFLTTINKQINPDNPNRKWRADLYSLLKHYIRGDSWAYSDIRNNDSTYNVNTMNLLIFIQLIKLIILNTRRVP
jgi:hypothetical protein